MIKFLSLISFSLSTLYSVTWSASTLIYNGSCGLSTLYCDIDSNGDGFALWNDQASNPSLPAQIKWTDELSGSWSNPDNLSYNLRNLKASCFSVNSNISGMLVSTKTDDNNTVFANRLNSSNIWEDPIMLSDPNYFCKNAVVVSSANGTSIALWVSNNGTYSRIFSSRFDGTSWDSAVALSNANTNAFNPQISINSSGDAIACWSYSDSGSLRIQARQYTSGSWQTPQTLSASNANSLYPSVAINASGNAICSWGEYDLSGNLHACTSIFSSGSWGSSAKVSTSNYISQFPQVTIDSSGNGFCVWAENDGTNTRITSAKYATSWQSPNYISASGINAFTFKVASDDSGNVVCIWKGVEQANNLLYAATNNGYWSSVQTLSNSIKSVGDFSLGINETGDIICAWESDEPLLYIEKTPTLTEPLSSASSTIEVKTASF